MQLPNSSEGSQAYTPWRRVMQRIAASTMLDPLFQHVQD